MTDLCFLDTECLGLHPDAPVWEFAAIRVYDNGVQRSVRLFIEHSSKGWLRTLAEPFRSDYIQRYDADKAFDELRAAAVIDDITAGAHIVGAVPNFDTERLAKLLWRNSIAPRWHYHLIDVENLAVGYLAKSNKGLAPPWKSDDLSKAIGIDPTQYNRHTAMGDVLWVKAQWDVIMKGEGT